MTSSQDIEHGSIVVDGSQEIVETDDNFICATIDWTSLILSLPRQSKASDAYYSGDPLILDDMFDRVKIDSVVRARNLLFDGSNNHRSSDANDLLLGAGLTNLEYGYLYEIMGRSLWAPQVFNCGAPDTGNMEVLLRYGNKEQLQEWLIPLLEGTIRSGFAMTEPHVASSDKTNIECSINSPCAIHANRDQRVIKTYGQGKSDFNAVKHKQQSMILVDVKTPGIHIKRPLIVFGFDDTPHRHAEVTFANVCVPAKNIILGEGRGFEIAQVENISFRLNIGM
ncbi:hypothetical protein JHK87_053001 [Glycine soja]|nr:hypothetical protein JHK87_053001 [Glycine soja]